MTGRPELRGTAVLAGGTIVSRVLGFVRDMLTAYLLGPGADAFLTAFRLPNIFRRLSADGILGMSPAYIFSRAAAAEGQTAAEDFSRKLIFASVVAVLPVTLLLLPVTGALVFLQAPGLTATPEVADRAAFLLRCALPYLPLSMVAAVVCSFAACNGNFLPQSFSSAVFNLCLIGVGLFALSFRGGDVYQNSVEAMPALGGAAEVALALGVTAGGLAQCCFAFFFLRRGRSGERRSGLRKVLSALPARIRAVFSDRYVREALYNLPKGAFGASVGQAQLLAGMFLASFLPSGSISALYFAERLIELPLGLAGAAISTAATPRLAMSAAERNMPEFSALLERNLSMSLFVGLPAAAGLAGTAYPLLLLLFGRGAFGPEEAARSAVCLTAYAFGMPAMCLSRPLLSALSALGKVNVFFPALGVGVAVTMAAALLGMAFFGAGGIAAGISAGAWAHMLFLAVMLHKNGVLGLWRRKLGSFLKYAAAAGALGAALQLFPFSLEKNSALLLQLGIAVTGGMFLWVGFFHLRSDACARDIVRLLKGK